MGGASGRARRVSCGGAAAVGATGRRFQPRAVADRDRRDDRVELPLSIPVENLGARAHFTVRREDGESFDFAIEPGDLPQTGSVELEGGTWVRKLATLPVRLPLGYHEVTVSVGADSPSASRAAVTSSSI